MEDEVAAAKKKLDEAKKAAAPKVVSNVGALIPVVKKELDDLKATFAKKEKKSIICLFYLKELFLLSKNKIRVLFRKVTFHKPF